MACGVGTVLVPSPLLNAELPEWMVLHFQASAKGDWRSPQVLRPELAAKLREPSLQLALHNVTEQRAQLLAHMNEFSAANLIAMLPDAGSIQTLDSSPTPIQTAQSEQQGQVSQGMWNNGLNNGLSNGLNNDLQQRLQQQLATKMEGRGNVANPQSYKAVPLPDEISLRDRDAKWAEMNPVTALSVKLGLYQPVWLTADDQSPELVIARLAQAGERKVVQGVLLDWPKLREILFDEIRDLFPYGQLEPVIGASTDGLDRRMTALPVQLNPGSTAMSILPGWSPTKTGLLLAWIAALGALTVVGLGGWSLLDLSERRIRFVSAVTHELRTPLTTLRLYLDMLTGGLIKDDVKKDEYLHTLHGESDRLHRLVSNVLDFARLERQRPKLSLREVSPAELLERVRANWHDRCKAAGKDLVVECAGDQPILKTDPDLVEQILGNLIDNACKYSRGAADERVWLRCERDASAAIFEVEDRGPGVPDGDKRGIFQAFRRGESADVTAGGVGLGLALALRWAHLLGGKLDVEPGRGGTGARFRLQL
jgi:signal transduction histidine kinase